MLFAIAMILVVALAAFIVCVAVQPEDTSISREITINAPPEKLFPYLNNSKKANEWMPWMESDPQVIMTYSGPEEGVGSKSSWDSPGKMGSGSALVVESIPNQLVKTQLSYTRPRGMEQLAEMTLTPVGEGTLVTWSVSGSNNFIARMFFVLFNCEKMVGDSFNKGLSKLKAMNEA